MKKSNHLKNEMKVLESLTKTTVGKFSQIQKIMVEFSEIEKKQNRILNLLEKGGERYDRQMPIYGRWIKIFLRLRKSTENPCFSNL